jgi:hypothetical protein
MLAPVDYGMTSLTTDGLRATSEKESIALNEILGRRLLNFHQSSSAPSRPASTVARHKAGAELLADAYYSALSN